MRIDLFRCSRTAKEISGSVPYTFDHTEFLRSVSAADIGQTFLLGGTPTPRKGTADLRVRPSADARGGRTEPLMAVSS
jgi:hypothetical protein